MPSYESDFLPEILQYKVVSDYIVPLLMAAWVTFVTTAVVRFMDHKKSVERAFGTAQRTIRTLNHNFPCNVWMSEVRRAYDVVFHSARDLEDDGHIDAAMSVVEFSHRILADVKTREANGEFDWNEVYFVGLGSPGIGEAKAQRIAQFLSDKYMVDGREVHDLQPTIVALLFPRNVRGFSYMVFFRFRVLLHRLDAKLDKAVKGRKSDCHCSNCGHRHGDV